MRIIGANGLCLMLLCAAWSRAGEAEDLATLRAASATEAAPPETQAAWRRLAGGGPESLPALLAAMKDANPAAENWLRACVDTVAERSLAAGALPAPELNRFLADTSNAPRARRTAFEWIVRVDPDAKARLLLAMQDDPSLELRYDAIAQLIETAESAPDKDKQVKIDLYRQALKSARDPKQIQSIADTLGELGEEVDVPGAMGFLKRWLVIGPFDNTALEHFDTAYPPEAAVDASAKLDGKEGPVEWQEATADAESAKVDFIEPLGKHKEAVAYAYATFTSPAAREAEIRYESKNATKVWLNGELVASHEIYHSGSSVDQYRTAVKLRAGENTLLVKACQNEQRMPWEREWEIRLRVVDNLGTPVVTQRTSVALRQ